MKDHAVRLRWDLRSNTVIEKNAYGFQLSSAEA